MAVITILSPPVAATTIAAATTCKNDVARNTVRTEFCPCQLRPRGLATNTMMLTLC